MLNKKGAMFGLDARIALAIFGALSVISGAALYSAIKQSKAIAMVSSLEEIGKAIDSYRLDTGNPVPKMNTSSASNYFYAAQTHELVDNSLSANGWKGPYLSYSKVSGTGSTNNVLDHIDYGSIWLLTLTNEGTFGDGVGNWTGGKCISGKSCYLYIVINGIDTDSLAKDIDEIVDGGDGGAAGKMRWYYESPAVKYNYFYQYSVVENPNS